MVNNESLINSLCAEPLPAAFTIKNFIQGTEKYNYEDYLLEFVNCSDFFKKRSSGVDFIHPAKENHGEPDCCSPKYSLDFKLFSSQALLQGQSLFSPQLTCLTDGVMIESVCRITSDDPKYKPIQATRIFAALRGIDLLQLMAIRNSKTNEQPDFDVRHLLEKMEVKKNLLLFFPYYFYFEDTVPFHQGRDVILEALNSDFSNVLQYRNIVSPNLDTYLCFLYKQNMILTQWEDSKLQYKEKIPIEKSPLFFKLLRIAADGFRWNGLK